MGNKYTSLFEVSLPEESPTSFEVIAQRITPQGRYIEQIIRVGWGTDAFYYYVLQDRAYLLHHRKIEAEVKLIEDVDAAVRYAYKIQSDPYWEDLDE